jgi:hypothetical protein
MATFTRDAELSSIVLTDEDRGGDDIITATGFSGDKILIGQFGADSISGGTQDDVVFGDLATLEFLPFGQRFDGQSSVDRIIRIEAIRADQIFDDTIFGGSGADFIMGGMGADILVGDDGQDTLIGDTVIFTRTWDASSDGLIERTTIDTNFAFVTGGYDQIRGGLGPDIMIGGLGRDLFFGNTQLDLIFSDGYAGIFTADWSAGYNADTPQRFLLTSNFAGSGAIDVVSESQQDSSIGGPLDYLAQNSRFDENTQVESRTYLDVLNELRGRESVFDDILSILGRNTTTESIVLLLMAGADTDLVMQALLKEIMAEMALTSGVAPLQLEMIIRTIVAEYLANAGLLNDIPTDENTADQTVLASSAIAAE